MDSQSIIPQNISPKSIKSLTDDNLLFEWKEIGYSVELPDSKTKETKAILQNNSGRVKSGEIVAM